MKTSEHTVKSFEQELADLISKVHIMKDMAIELIELSQKSLLKTEENFYDLAKSKDQKINDLEKEIEAQAISLLALRQPMASDLRIIVSTIKIISLLERIADRGKKNTKKAMHLTHALDAKIIDDVFAMNKIVINMVNQVFNSLEEYKFSQLQEAVAEDDKVDEFYSKTMHKIMEVQKTNPMDLDEFIAQIKILKNFERIGDYATKIAKIIYYIAEGSNRTF